MQGLIIADHESQVNKAKSSAYGAMLRNLRGWWAVLGCLPTENTITYLSGDPFLMLIFNMSFMFFYSSSD